VSEGCCLCNYRSDIPEDTNLQEAHFAVQWSVSVQFPLG
jgi:hypothetical protein